VAVLGGALEVMAGEGVRRRGVEVPGRDMSGEGDGGPDEARLCGRRAREERLSAILYRRCLAVGEQKDAKGRVGGGEGKGRKR
jgi:hypothetical protein